MSAGRPGGGFLIRVDRLRCVGAGMCAGVAPEEFEVDGAGRARPRRATGHSPGALAEAAAMCPVEAITVFEAGSGRRVAPPD
ncbi:ferredoxin [Streptomyces sp. BBFR2]|uniref:ferredoxin n=1 Tax=Streptomyces sp. BBFR2 TaxID=3372854 RepID=UPI0037D99C70